MNEATPMKCRKDLQPGTLFHYVNSNSNRVWYVPPTHKESPLTWAGKELVESTEPPTRVDADRLCSIIWAPPAEKPPASLLTTDKAARKGMPITTGVFDYFPRALAEIARVSKAGNDQHNPGQPLHWDKTKSLDHADCIGRHLIERGTVDDDGMRHSAKLAWRALALLETELEASRG